MRAPRLQGPLALSLALHGALTATAIALRPTETHLLRITPTPPVEVEILPTPPETAPPVPAPTHREVPARPASPLSVARVGRALGEVRAPVPLATVEAAGGGAQRGPEAPPEARPSPAPTTPLDGLELLRHGSDTALRDLARGTLDLGVRGNGHPGRSLAPEVAGRPSPGALAVANAPLRRWREGRHRHEAPGVRGYLWTLRRRMEEAWRPRVVHEVTLVDTLVATLAMPLSAQQAVQRAAFGPAAAPSRQGAAIDALEGPRGGVNTPGALQAQFTGIIDASAGNTRVTRAEVEVEQDAAGVVQRIRVVHSSQLPSFDAEAVGAVREALPLQPPVAMPGGRRSRWSFQVVVSRDPFVPGVGIAFDESTGWFEVHVPGRRHLRSRVWLEDARPLVGG